nr:hypothetical protein CFP56_00426 [Quercus suber]
MSPHRQPTHHWNHIIREVYQKPGVMDVEDSIASDVYVLSTRRERDRDRWRHEAGSAGGSLRVSETQAKSAHKHQPRLEKLDDTPTVDIECGRYKMGEVYSTRVGKAAEDGEALCSVWSLM